MTVSINQVFSGMGLRINNSIFIVTDYEHVKPGKGSAFVRLKLKNVKTQQVLERTFKTADKLEDVELKERKLQNLYKNGDSFHFMDLTSYEELIVNESVIGDDIKFLQDNAEVVGLCLDDKVLKINLPTFIESEVKYTEPGVQGDSSKAGTKPAEIETGVTINVPLFVDIGDKIKIDTRTGAYVERLKR